MRMLNIVRVVAGWVGAAAVATVAVFGTEILMALPWGASQPFINPSHEPRELGDHGPTIHYVVMGDSTGAGEGAPYGDGIAMGTARHLARTHRVILTNISVSGATLEDVVRVQLPEAAALKPNLVLLSASANDSTHFTSVKSIRNNVNRIVAALRAPQPDVAIVVTGCPDMGAVPRFAQPLRWFAGTQTERINDVFAVDVHQLRLTWAQIAAETGPVFRSDPTLFYSDHFHPNARGYAVWIPVLNRAIDHALAHPVTGLA